MSNHEYRVVPAPRKGLRARGVRRPEERFARTVEAEMNRMAAEGWEFVRSDTLPCERRAGWFSRPTTVFETLLVFRRDKAEAETAADSRLETGSAAMPPPVSIQPAEHVTPPAAPSVTPPAATPAVAPVAHVAPPAQVPPPPVSAPSASRFTPLPRAARPANDGTPVVMPPTPTLAVVEPAPDAGPAEADKPKEPDEPSEGRAHAAE